MIEIAFASAFGYGWAVIAMQLLTGRKASHRALRASLVYLVVVTGLAVVNFEGHIFEQKLAGEFALTGEASTFVVQTAVNKVPFLLTGAWWAAIGTNVAAMAVTYCYLYDRGRRTRLIMWAPGVLNFAMFSLRDPLIGVCFLALTALLCRPRLSTRGRAVELAVAGITYLSRPETIAIYLAARFGGIRKRIGKRTWMYALLPFALLAAAYGLTLLPRLLGLPGGGGLASLPDTLSDFFVVRAERHAGDAGSDILGGRLASLPLPVRLPIQILTFFVLPLPFEIRGLALLLAFVDSVVFMYFTRRFLRLAPVEAKRLFFVYVLAVSFFASNYGNLLRLRLPAYFILAAGLLMAERSERRRPSRSDQRPAAAG